LDEKIDRVKSAANGARQRALNAIGSSVAEQNEKERQTNREWMQERLEPGDIVKFRDPSLYVGEAVRVNKKTVTVTYPHPHAGEEKHVGEGTYPEMTETRVELESGFLAKVDAETIEEGEELVDGVGK